MVLCMSCSRCPTNTSWLSRSRLRTGMSAIGDPANESLFHIVVDNDDTATKILDVMDRERGGRVTFMPLNRLKTPTINMPSAPDAMPMISKLKFDRVHVQAMEHVSRFKSAVDSHPGVRANTRLPRSRHRHSVHAYSSPQCGHP